MQKTNLLKRSLSTKEKIKAIPIVPSQIGAKKEAALPSLKLCSSTAEITCYDFWSMIINGDLSKLIISEFDESQLVLPEVRVQLNERFLELQIESAETRCSNLMNDQATMLEYNCMVTELNAIGASILYLRTEYDKKLTDWLRDRFCTACVALDISRPFQFQRDLDRCIAVTQTWQFEMEKMVNILNEVYDPQKDKEQKGEITMQSFYSTLTHMEKFRGISINPYEMSVMQYDTIYRQMVDLINKNKINEI